MSAGHERGHFLVPRLNKFGIAAGPREGGQDAVDAVAREAEDAMDAPLTETFQEEIADFICHGKSS